MELELTVNQPKIELIVNDPSLISSGYMEHMVYFSDFNATPLNSSESNYFPITWTFNAQGDIATGTMSEAFAGATVRIFQGYSPCTVSLLGNTITLTGDISGDVIYGSNLLIRYPI